MSDWSRCFRCGEPATTELVEMIAHGASPICERCLVEIQTKHARERARALPGLERRLAKLGGPLKGKPRCGYVSFYREDDPVARTPGGPWGKWCERPQGHDGFHRVAA